MTCLGASMRDARVQVRYGRPGASEGDYAELYSTYFGHQSLDYIESSRRLFVDESAVLA